MKYINIFYNKKDLNICILEKGSEIGFHIVSGNCFDTRALDELFPNWKNKEEIPVTQKVYSDELYFYSKYNQIKIPNMFLPKKYKNYENYIISLGQLCKWLASEAEELGVDILVGFAGSEILYCQENGYVKGVATNDFGISKDGTFKETYQRGMQINAPFTILSEGARGSLSEQVIDKFNLRKNCGVPTYGLGFKEVWEFDPEIIKQIGPGRVIHTLGYPMDYSTYGGGFLYTMESGLAQVGYIIGLDYKNPHMNLYQEFQLWKSHPHIKMLLEKGRCINYGARVINQGGYDTIPELAFPGGALIGCSAGFVDILKIKGTHNAMKTGMLAAEQIIQEIINKGGIQFIENGTKLSNLQEQYQQSWVGQELKKARYVKQNFKQSFFKGITSAMFSMFGLSGITKKSPNQINDSEIMDNINK